MPINHLVFWLGIKCLIQISEDVTKAWIFGARQLLMGIQGKPGNEVGKITIPVVERRKIHKGSTRMSSEVKSYFHPNEMLVLTLLVILLNGFIGRHVKRATIKICCGKVSQLYFLHIAGNCLGIVCLDTVTFKSILN